MSESVPSSPASSQPARPGCTDSRVDRGRQWRGRYVRAVQPRPDGLPRIRVLLAFPALLLVIGVVLVALGINGSSSGYMRELVTTSADPNLVAGEPQFTRSDEWNVQTVWAIAQLEQGLPVENRTFPGGMDATVPQDLPRWDWSVAFRPHLWGFLILDADHAIAFKWWLPGLALMAAAYAFLLSVMPRRPGISAMFAVGFFFSPLIQWWYLATTLWPAAWALASMAAVIWTLKTRDGMSRWVWGVIVGYLSVVMAMGIYVPFIVPAAITVVFFAAGSIIRRVRDGMTAREILSRLWPLLVCGLLAGGVTLYWLYEKRTVVGAFLNTAYPGARVTPTGGSDALSFASAVGSSFTQALNAGHPGMLGANSSEASTFFYLGIYLLPVIVWMVMRQARAGRRLPWELIAFVGVVVLLLAYLYIPGWDSVAKLFLLDKTIAARVRLGLGIASLGMFAFVVRYLDRERIRAGLWLAIVPAALFLLSQIAIGIVAIREVPAMVRSAPLWWLWAILSAVVIFAVARRHVKVASVAFLIVTIAGSGLANPLYLGVYDLRTTPMSREVQKIDDANQIDDANPGTWVGLGSRLTTAVLLESGVTAYNGFQGAPSKPMWSVIDPHSRYEYQWNRLAGVNWIVGPGEPIVSNPAGDQIAVTFDACSHFAQSNVDYVLSDDGSIDTTCLTSIDSFTLPKKSIMRIYAVRPPAQ